MEAAKWPNASPKNSIRRFSEIDVWRGCQSCHVCCASPRSNADEYFVLSCQNEKRIFGRESSVKHSNGRRSSRLGDLGLDDTQWVETSTFESWVLEFCRGDTPIKKIQKHSWMKSCTSSLHILLNEIEKFILDFPRSFHFTNGNKKTSKTERNMTERFLVSPHSLRAAARLESD